MRDAAAARADRRAGARRRRRAARSRWCGCRRPRRSAAGQGGGFPAPFDAGPRARPACTCTGRMPDALLRGATREPRTDSNRLALPGLPDRWVVLRLLHPGRRAQAWRPAGCSRPNGRCRSTFADCRGAAPAATPAGAADRRDRAHRHRRRRRRRGRRPTTRSINRFALHDPLDDVDTLAPRASTATARPMSSPAGGPTPTRDPLDAACDQGSLDALAAADWGGAPVAPWVDAPADQRCTRRGRPPAVVGRQLRLGRPLHDDAGAPSRPRCPTIATEPVQPMTGPVQSRLVERRRRRVLRQAVVAARVAAARQRVRRADQPARPRRAGPGRSTTGRRRNRCRSRSATTTTTCSPRWRPARSHRRPTVPGATPSGCSARSPRRCCASSGTPDGAAAVEEHEHGIAFGSFPGGYRGEDRFLAGSAGVRGQGRAAARRRVEQARTLDFVRAGGACPCRRSMPVTLSSPASSTGVS